MEASRERPSSLISVFRPLGRGTSFPVLPPIGQGEELSRDMIYQALGDHDISFGLDTALIDRVSRDRERYFTLYLVAKGKPAFDGRNGNIVDNFPRVLQRTLEGRRRSPQSCRTLSRRPRRRSPWP